MTQITKEEDQKVKVKYSLKKPFLTILLPWVFFLSVIGSPQAE